jgi:Fur family ferric uptake transcriptional regulator
MQKSAYKTKQQELLLSYLSKMQGKHFTAEEIRAHFEAKKNLYRNCHNLPPAGKACKRRKNPEVFY